MRRLSGLVTARSRSAAASRQLTTTAFGHRPRLPAGRAARVRLSAVARPRPGTSQPPARLRGGIAFNPESGRAREAVRHRLLAVMTSRRGSPRSFMSSQAERISSAGVRRSCAWPESKICRGKRSRRWPRCRP
jgi:hypothetical protein